MPQSSYSPLMRITALAVIITFTMLILEPTAVAAKVLHDEHLEAVAIEAREEAAQLAQTLQTVETTLTELQTELSDDTRLAKLNLGQTQKMFKGLKLKVLNLDEQVQIDFEAVENHLRAKKLPNEILQRHQNAVTTYRQHLATLLANLEDILVVKNKGQLRDKADKALKHLKPLQKPGKHPHFDPNNLPFNVPDGKKVRSPKEDEKELKKLFPAEVEPVKVAATTLLPEMLTVAAAPDATYLQSTTDVQITPEIEALALELEHKPVAIYNWVHDNIQFIPTYGSIQGSQLTLENRAGNATDTASLLIALLRASGIHARYVYGTVQIPIEKVMNWVGGVTSPDAAIQILGQGGIPISGVVQGGQIAFIKMEHIWVDAWVDYRPSRGARHRKGDSWIPMDASFKQYQFTEGMDIQENVSFDAEGFVEQLTQNAQINETEGWVSGIDQTFMETSLQNYQTQMEAYITQTNPEATVGEVLGTQTIIPSKRPTLSAGLPYKLIAKGNQFKTLPANLRHHLTIKLYDSLLDKNLDNPSLTHTVLLSTLGYQRLGMTFVPSTETDAQALAELVQTGAETLPPYLFNLKPVLKLDETELVTGSSIGMGQKQYYTLLLSDPQTTYPISGQITVGDEIVFGINGNGVTSPMLLNRLEQVSSHSAAENLHITALHYWFESDLLKTLLAQINGIVQYRLPSVGLFSSPLSVESVFGIPKTGNYKGRAMDVKHARVAVGTVDQQKFLTFMMQAGMQDSYLESSVFEQLFPGLAVSAAKFLETARQQSIPIFSLTQANISTALPLLAIDNDLKQTLQHAVQVGNHVIIPQQTMTIGQYTGIGYIVQDPITGSGAYMIDGGFNGGRQLSCQGSTQPEINIFDPAVVALLANKHRLDRTIVLILIKLSVAQPKPVKAPRAIAVEVILLLMTMMYAYKVKRAMREIEEQVEDELDVCSFRLVSVSFLNDIDIYKDQVDQAPLIEDPVWIDQNGDTLPEINERVGYVSGYNINLKATFEVKTLSGEPLEDVTIKAENAQLGLSGTVYLGNVIGPVSTEPFYFEQFQVGLTQYFSPDEPFKLEWSYSSDGGAFQNIGVSKHTVYVTYGDYSESEELGEVYLSLLHWAVSNDGATNPKQVVWKTWQHFANRNLTTWYGRELRYYPHQKPDDLEDGVEACLIHPSGYVECTDFVDLLSQTLLVNNISHNLVGVELNNGGKMMVKNWAVNPPISFPGEDYPLKFILFKSTDTQGSMISPTTGKPTTMYGDLINIPGIAGQNVPTPVQKVFESHQILHIPSDILPSELVNELGIPTPYIDPSYGVTYKDEKDFAQNALFGYVHRDVIDQTEDKDGNNILIFKAKKADFSDNLVDFTLSPIQ